MSYTIVTKLTPHDRSLVFENTADWENANDFFCDEMVESVPGLTSCTLELQADGKSVIRTMVYESVDARVAHASNKTLLGGRRPEFFTNTHISESEPTPSGEFSTT